MLFLRIEVPDTLPVEKIDFVPADVAAFQLLGDEWIRHKASPAMKVPSVLVPRQWNLLLNPCHPLFLAIRVVEEAPFAFDSRLLSSIPNP